MFVAAPRLSLVVWSGGYSPVAICKLLTALALLVVEHGHRHAGFSSCGAKGVKHMGFFLTRVKLVSPVLAGRFISTGPPWWSSSAVFIQEESVSDKI